MFKEVTTGSCNAGAKPRCMTCLHILELWQLISMHRCISLNEKKKKTKKLLTGTTFVLYSHFQALLSDAGSDVAFLCHHYISDASLVKQPRLIWGENREEINIWVCLLKKGVKNIQWKQDPSVVKVEGLCFSPFFASVKTAQLHILQLTALFFLQMRRTLRFQAMFPLY